MNEYKEQICHPWQSGPTELIAHGLEHLHKADDFDQRIAFLSLDVGIETLFKTFLSLPEKVSAVKNSYGDRKKAIEGNFHTLIQGMEQARPDIAKKYNLAHVQSFHDIRNKLYHDGNGITVEREKLSSYSEIAVGLLKDLLDIDLGELLSTPDAKSRHVEENEKIWKAVEDKKEELMLSRNRLGEVARYVAEIIAPGLAKSVFIRTLQKNYSESEEKAAAYLFRSFENTFPKEVKRIPLHELSVNEILNDTNKLYIFIATVFLETENALDVYDLSNYDPKEIIREDDVHEEDGQIVVHTLSPKEYATEITNWISGNITDVNKNISMLELWLEKQNL